QENSSQLTTTEGSGVNSYRNSATHSARYNPLSAGRHRADAVPNFNSTSRKAPSEVHMQSLVLSVSTGPNHHVTGLTPGTAFLLDTDPQYFSTALLESSSGSQQCGYSNSKPLHHLEYRNTYKELNKNARAAHE